MPDAPLRLLLIEDDEDDYLLTRELLEEIGKERFVLEWVRTGDAGREALGRQVHDVCLMDYRLGNCTGLELLQAVNASSSPIPIILLTGQGDHEIDLEAMRLGAADYLVKGELNAGVLERAIRYAIGRKKTEQELRQARNEQEDRVRERTAELEQTNRALRTEIQTRAHLEAELRKHAEELAETDRRKDEFLAMLAHELRNPLTPIRNAIQLLNARGDDPHTVNWVRDLLNRQVAHLTHLVDDLLDAARIVQDKIRLRLERVDLAEIVRSVAEDHRAALEAADVRLLLAIPNKPIWVQGDAVRLAQVTGNLLNNAGKFTDAGGIVSVQLEETASERAAVTVADTGVGIEPDLLPRLFDKFTQSDRSLARSKGGLGLGLALVRGLIELHGGTVRAHSDGPGHGAAFRYELPMDHSEPVSHYEPAATLGNSRCYRILVIEDNHDAADSLRLLLQYIGHEVEVAYNGPDGVQCAKQLHPDLVLCDLGLPGMTGFDVARALRNEPATATVRLIAVSGYGQDEDQRRARAAGFDDHLVKPLDLDVLQNKLKSWDCSPSPAPHETELSSR